MWSDEDDAKLKWAVGIYGENSWRTVKNYINNGKTISQLRYRWTEHLNPKVNNEPLTEDERTKIIELQSIFGNNWAKIAKQIERTPIRVKNFCKKQVDAINNKIRIKILHRHPDGLSCVILKTKALSKSRRIKANIKKITKNDSMGNQSVGNQSVGNDSMGNQSVGNQSVGNQSVGNQSIGNDSMGNDSMGNDSMGNDSMGNQSVGNQSIVDDSIGSELHLIEPETQPKTQSETQPETQSETQPTIQNINYVSIFSYPVSILAPTILSFESIIQPMYQPMYQPINEPTAEQIAIVDSYYTIPDAGDLMSPIGDL
jgi:hypothetical protein